MEKEKNIQLCLGETNVLYRIAKRISDRNIFLQNGEAYPFAVNISLSCELYLKYLLLINNIEHGKSHSLDKLYELLPFGIKEEISKKYGNIDGRDIKGFLQNQKNAFV